MQFPDNEVTHETEAIMKELVAGQKYSVEKYNAAYSALHALLTDIDRRAKITAPAKL